MQTIVPPLNQDEAEVRAVLDGMAQAHRDRDAAAVNRHVAADATLADLAPPLWRRGPDTAALQAWLDGWDGPVEISYRDLEVRVEGGLALCHGLVHTQAPRGGETAAWWARMTTVLARSEDGWRVIHELFSVPFYMDGSERAALDLHPET
jgi:ketosteroid isomerase-like protein